MSWRVEILTALRTRLLTVPGISGWPVIYANRKALTEPTPDTRHIRETSFKISSDDASIGQAVRWRELVSTWQVTLCVPFDSDVFPALTFADTLELAFLLPPIALPSGDALRVSAVTVESAEPRDDHDAWLRIAVTFTFTVLTHT